MNSVVIVSTYNATVRQLLKKFDFQPYLIQWIFLLQEFDLKIQDKVELENVVADHLSHLGLEAILTEELPIDNSFPNHQLLAISYQASLWYAGLVN